MNYVTIALRTNNEGGTGTETLYSGKDKAYAEKKYHEEMAAAATSGRPMHAAFIVGWDGLMLDTGCYGTGEVKAGE